MLEERTTDIRNLVLVQQKRYTNMCHAAQEIARGVSSALDDAFAYGLALSEETITDSLALCLARIGGTGTFAGDTKVHVAQHTKRREHRTGADWEWFIGNGKLFDHYIVQSKRLDMRATPAAYRDLRTRDRRQIRTLLDAADIARSSEGLNTTPLYAFYNGCRQRATPDHGITITSAARLLEMLENGCRGTFTELHDRRDARPWETLFCAAPEDGRRKPLPDRMKSWIESASHTRSDSGEGGGGGTAARLEIESTDGIFRYARRLLLVVMKSEPPPTDEPMPQILSLE